LSIIDRLVGVLGGSGFLHCLVGCFLQVLVYLVLRYTTGMTPLKIKYYHIYFAFKICRPGHSRHRLVKKKNVIKSRLTTLFGVTTLQDGEKQHYSKD